MNTMPPLILNYIAGFLDFYNAGNFAATNAYLWSRRKYIKKPQPQLKIHIAPSHIYTYEEAWKYCQPQWGDEIRFERLGRIGFSNGHSITHGSVMDRFILPPDGFYVLEEGRPLNFWSSYCCRIKVPQEVWYDEDFIYFKKNYKVYTVSVFNEKKKKQKINCIPDVFYEGKFYLEPCLHIIV